MRKGRIDFYLTIQKELEAKLINIYFEYITEELKEYLFNYITDVLVDYGFKLDDYRIIIEQDNYHKDCLHIELYFFDNITINFYLKPCN